MGLTALKTLFCTLLLALPVGFAQHFYLGATIGTPLSAPARLTDYVEFGAQLGFDPLPGFGVRVGVEGNPFNSGLKLAGGDAIFRFFLPLSATSLYTGIGADALFATQPTSLTAFRDAQLVAHVVGGLELRLGSFGVFGELLPSYKIGADFTNSSAYFVRLKGGVNVHF